MWQSAALPIRQKCTPILHSNHRSSWLQTLRSAVQLRSRSGAFPLTEKLSLQLFWSYYFVSYNDLCHLVSAVVSQWSNSVRAKIVTRLPWEHFQILIFCVVIAHSFSFLPPLRHCVLLSMLKHPSKSNKMAKRLSTVLRKTELRVLVLLRDRDSSFSSGWLLYYTYLCALWRGH